MKWFRLYHRILDDPDFLKLPDAGQAFWMRLLAAASRSATRGTILATDTPTIARLTCSDQRTVAYYLPRYEAMAWVARCAEGVLLVSWEDLQPNSDDVAPRMAESRKNAKLRGPRDVTGNVTGTVTVTHQNENEIQNEKKNDQDLFPASGGSSLPESPPEPQPKRPKKPKATPDEPKPHVYPDGFLAVYDLWIHERGYPEHLKPLADDVKFFNLRRKDGFTTHDLRCAVYGIAFDDWLCGKRSRDNEKAVAQDGFSQIFRNAELVRRLIPYGIEEDARRKERMATEEVSAPLLDMKARVAEYEKEVRAEWEAAHGKKVADG